MSEELIQKNLKRNPEKIGKWDFYNIGATTIKQLKENGIIRNIDYGKEEKKKVDALIVKKKNVIAIIEYKQPSNFNTYKKKQKAIKQELEVAKKLKTNLLIATDGQESVWINVSNGNQIKDESGKTIKLVFDPKSEKLPELIEKINSSINIRNDQIKPKELVNPTDLAKKIWQIVWSISGATPESCLYSFVELFIFKYLSDLKVLQEPENFESLLKLYEKRDPEYVIDYYARNIRLKIKNDLFPKGSDGTTIINGTVFVNNDDEAIEGRSTAFEKILKEFNNYRKLDNIHPDFKSQLFESFLKESISQKNWGQFFTPLKVVKSIVEMSKDDIKPGFTIGDPASGVGKFLLEAIKPNLNNFYKVKKNELISNIDIFGYDIGFDKDEQKTIILAKANMLIYFSELLKNNKGITKEFASLFNKSFELKKNSILGTLASKEEEKYDLILSNPPYVTSGSSNIKEEIKRKGLSNYYKINAMGLEGLFMEWIIKALKPNGKAFIVVPDGIFNRQNDAKLRKYIIDECYLDAIISLPEKTFFATPKKTYILAITKKNNVKEVQTNPVFTYLVSEIGETRDVYRFDIEQNDLNEAVTLFSFYKGNKTSFEKINSDKRCKIQPINNFQPNNYWSIDRWWTKEEKIELGIEEEENVISTEEFGDLIKDISSTLEEFSEIAKEISLKKKKTKFKEISLNNKSFFDLSIGKRIIKKEIVKLSGDIPIYSANVFNPVGFSNKSNIKNYDNDFVLWGIDGDFKFNAIAKNTPFTTTDHCGTIRILNENIFPKYLMIQLDNIKNNYGFDRGLRSSLKNMSKIKIKIPFNENNGIDIEKQKEIIEKHNTTQEIKNKVSEYRKRINDLRIDIKDNYSYKDCPISEIFTSPPTNSGLKRIDTHRKRTEEYCIPVYSASMDKNLIFGWVSKDNKWKKYENVLTWNKDGSSGLVFYRKELFVPYEKVKLLKVKDKYKKTLKYEFLQIVVQITLLKQGYDFKNKCSMANVMKLKIPIPIDKSGEFNIKAQEEITKKLNKIESIKKITSQKLETIENIKIAYE